jgi:hypothetical protein
MAKKKKNQPLYSESELKHFKYIKDKQQLVGKLLEVINAERKYDDFFSNYRADTIEHFKKDLANFKAEYIQDGAWYFKHKRELESAYYKKAEGMLWHIQQKKLFDLQCLWRAEKIQLPGVETTHDFSYWSVDIKRCPFLEPITESEADLLRQYVLSLSFEKPLLDLYDWDDYEQFTEEHKGDPQSLAMPEWYHYYNMHRGTESLMLLPDIRGEKEEPYMMTGLRDLMDKNQPVFTETDIVRKEKKSVQTDDAAEDNDDDNDDPPPYQSAPLNFPGDRRPWIQIDRDTVFTDFIKEFEDAKLHHIHAIRRRLDENNLPLFDHLELDNAMETLRPAGDHYPMEPWYRWREAVSRTARKFEQDRLSSEIPAAFDAYLLREKSQVTPFISRQEKQEIKEAASLLKDKKQWILHGRKLKNEPLNFDF